MTTGTAIDWRGVHMCVVIGLSAMAWTTSIATAQDPPFETELVGTWDGFDGSYADVWADGDYAYVGQFGDSGVLIIDISNPSNPFLAAEYLVPKPNHFSSAQDIKVGDGLLFITLEGNETPDDVMIVDVRDPLNPVMLTTIRTPAVGSPHNLFYDRGFLYMVDSSSESVAVFDLTDFDPDNPPVDPINETKWVIENVGTSLVHDITVRERESGATWLYVCGWSSGLWVYDVTNIADEPPQFLTSVDGNSTHSVWPTDTGQFVITGEERTGGGITVYEVIEDGDTVSLQLRDNLVLPADQAVSVHNQVCVGNRVYNSWYQGGMRAYDVDPIDGHLTLASSFDTFAGDVQGFNGAWGIYPLLGSDRVLVSDLSTGFYIIDDQAPPQRLSITFPDGLFDSIDPMEGTTLPVNISARNESPDSDSATLMIGPADGSETFEAVAMVFLGDDMYEAQIPGPLCGNPVSYYVSVTTLEGNTVTDPEIAPMEVYGADVVTEIIEILNEDFETDTGWTTSSEAETGAWVRAVPQGNHGNRSDPPSDFDGSGKCFVTGNDENEDLDGGPVILTSSTFDISSLQNPVLRYARWFANDDGDEVLTVEISNDNGNEWVILEEAGNSVGWVETRFDVIDFVAPTDSIMLRFTTCDCPNNSLTEAAVDSVRFEEWICIDATACEGDANGDGTVDPLDAGFVLARFGCSVGMGDPDCDAADQNSDGAVDPLDTGFILARFGDCE